VSSDSSAPLAGELTGPPTLDLKTDKGSFSAPFPVELLSPGHQAAIDLGPAAVLARSRETASGTAISLTLLGRSEFSASSLAIRFPLRAREVFEHGFQSWSPTRFCSPEEVLPERSRNSALALAMHFSEPAVAGRRVSSDSFTLFETAAGGGHLIGFAGSTRHFSSLTWEGDGLCATAQLDGTVVGSGKERALHDLVVMEGPYHACLAGYLELLSSLRPPAPGKASPTGWCSWYQYYWGVRFEDVVRDLDFMAAMAHFPLFQVDDGYQACLGRWTEAKPGWPDLREVASIIRSKGKIPGIWLAPFLVCQSCLESDPVADLVLRTPDGEPVVGMVNPGWGGNAYALDVAKEEALSFVQHALATLSGFGFSYFKLDFLYAAALSSRPDATRAELYRRALSACREAVGEEAFLLACGAPLLASAGLADGARISPDTDSFWQARAYPYGLKETAPSMHNAFRTSLYRAALHGRLFLADPDCVLMRPLPYVSADRRLAFATMALALGGAFVVSDAATELDEGARRAMQALAPALSRYLSPEPPVLKKLSRDEVAFERAGLSFSASGFEDDTGEVTVSFEGEVLPPWLLGR
jgi:alpha-galactosidase